ncbi:MAG: AtzE family amidohydrolase [Azospirillaceae bacterium]
MSGGVDATAEATIGIASAVRAGRCKAEAVVERSLARIERMDGAINAMTAVLGDRARSRARALDARIARGEDPGPLAGVPFAVKNLFDIEGVVTLAGSRINRDDPPAARDAPSIAALEAAGAVLVGAAGMGEYAYDFTGRNAHDGVVRNPLDPDRLAGGSSSGSAAAVAAGMVPFALGTDTNGSIRVPASLCGLFGLKPTFGRLGRDGVFPFVESLDHVGPLARSAADLAVIHDALQTAASVDRSHSGRPVEPVTPALGDDTPLRVGLAGGYAVDRAGSEARRAAETVADALGAFGRVDLDGAGEARAAAFVITAAAGGALHLDRLRRRAGDFDEEVRGRLIAGALVPAAWVARAERVRRAFAERMATVFERVDLLVAPATPCPAPLIDQPTIEVGGEPVPVRANLGVLTQPFSAIGLPVACVPVHPGDGGMPVGVQIVGPLWREDLVLAAAHRLELWGVATVPSLAASAAAPGMRS